MGDAPNAPADMTEYLSMGGEGDRSQIASDHTCCFMSKEVIENLAAVTGTNGWRYIEESFVVGKQFGEAERAGFHLRFDPPQELASTREIWLNIATGISPVIISSLQKAAIDNGFDVEFLWCWSALTKQFLNCRIGNMASDTRLTLSMAYHLDRTDSDQLPRDMMIRRMQKFNWAYDIIKAVLREGMREIPMAGREQETARLHEIVLNDLRLGDDGARAAFQKEFSGELGAFAEATTTALDSDPARSIPR
jgi:hypothetical protein